MGYFTIGTIEISLDSKSLSRAIMSVRHLKQQLSDAMQELIEKLTDQGVSIAKMQVASLDAVDTGELENSIFGYYDAEMRIGFIVAGALHAFYVEYGTGPMGMDNPHPQAAEAGWHYMVGETIHENLEHPDWGVGWYYPGDDGQKHWTQGQPSRPFMLNTLTWLEEAAEHFGVPLHV